MVSIDLIGALYEPSLNLIGVFGNGNKIKPLKFVVKGIGGRLQMWTAYRTDEVLKEGIKGSLG